jgi:hypothetical protein
MDKTKIILAEDSSDAVLAARILIQSMNDMYVLSDEVSTNIFELHNFHRHYKEPKLKAPVEHGEYRKFIKRDKRKNFKLNK